MSSIPFHNPQKPPSPPPEEDLQKRIGPSQIITLQSSELKSPQPAVAAPYPFRTDKRHIWAMLSSPTVGGLHVGGFRTYNYR